MCDEFNPQMKPTDPCKILGDSVAAALLKKSDLLILDESTLLLNSTNDHFKTLE